MTLIDLSDGRVLDIEVSGPEDGFPLVYQHGTPSSRVPFRMMQRAAHDRGLRLVTFSRAGYGASTRRAGRDVGSETADVAAVLDHLGADRCLTAGWSGGGPHVLACAVGLPDRVVGALVISGVAPYESEGLDFLAGMGEQNLAEFDLALKGEDALRPPLQQEADEMGVVDPAGLIEGMSTLLPEVDRAVLSDEFGADLAATFNEALRLGVDGWVDDSLALVQPWGFDVRDVAVPTFVWQGSEDLMVPFAHGQWLAERIPGAAAHLIDGEGHLSVLVNRLADMLDELDGIRPRG